jgi:hypothetical protein
MPSKTQSVLLAGIAAGVITSLFTFIPLVGGCLGCLMYMAAGVLAVWHYTSTHEVTIPGGQGAGMGALAGLLSGAAASGLQQLFIATGIQPDMAEQVRQQMESSGAQNDQQGQMLEMFSSPEFLVIMIAVGLLLAAILGAVGGAVGASLFKKGDSSPGSAPDVA